LRPGRPDRAFHMEGHRLETHVAGVIKADRGDNQDPAVDAASAKEALTRRAAIRQPPSAAG
jgi:hypothetical protein